MKPEEFDKQFNVWLALKTNKTVEGFATWTAKVRNVAKLLDDKKFDEVIKEGTEIEGIYPDYVEHGSVYEQVAFAYEAKGDSASARKELQKYAELGGRSPANLKKLASLDEQLGDKAGAAKTLNRLNFIYPEDEDLHKRLGTLYADLGNQPGAVREFEALVNSKPVDVAGAHYSLARAYKAVGKNDQAKDEVLQSLEVAPGFKPAQRLLLELDGKD
jgi:cellulose synthase operon protein C